MLIEGSYTFQAPVERIFATLTDADALRAALPGCERLIQLGPPQADGAAAYEARLRLRDAVYTAGVTIAPEASATRLRFTLDGRGPEGAFRGTGRLTLTGHEDQTVGAYALEIVAPGLTEAQARSLANGASKLYAAALCDQLLRELRVPGGEPAGEAADESLRFQRMEELLRTRTPYGQIVAIPSTPPAPFTPVWWQYVFGMLAGLGAGLAMIGLAVAMLRRLRGARGPAAK